MCETRSVSRPDAVSLVTKVQAVGTSWGIGQVLGQFGITWQHEMTCYLNCC